MTIAVDWDVKHQFKQTRNYIYGIHVVDPYFFSCPSYAPFLSYVPLKTKFDNLVCRISQKVFELVFIYWLELRRSLTFEDFPSNLNTKALLHF